LRLKNSRIKIIIFLFLGVMAGFAQQNTLILNEWEYFEMPGLNVMIFHDIYPEGHQGGISIIQNGVRVASNGDIRLEAAPGQWQPVPAVGKRSVDFEKQLVSVYCTYPDPRRNRTGYNPIDYPDLSFGYDVNVSVESTSVRISVDLEEALPAEWIGKIGFNLELFPGGLFGKSYLMNEQVGIFPRLFNGPLIKNEDGTLEDKPLAEGSHSATVAYGVNRADWSYIPGGVISGTALIRPDLPELKEWPFFWQQNKYVIGGVASNFMFLVLAAKQLLENE